LPVLWYAYETSSLTLREEQRLGRIENRALRRIFGQKSDEIIEIWRKLYNEELDNLYSLRNIITMISQGG
jgi:hypothetical protein